MERRTVVEYLDDGCADDLRGVWDAVVKELNKERHN
jgi:hypothetical protein